ncbi:zinc finger protein 708-like [Ornithodoros turicata]|uniref:zinc finger protein 708-like n=1 Tax=Ornithodoros turicata TaxID=34597 RepID=UPI003139C837
MRLSPELSGQPVRVKSEPLDPSCLPEEDQVHQRRCGVTAGMCHIKEEPREESSNTGPIMEVKTEPYNVAILTEQDQMGHSCDSTSEGMTAGMCDIKEEPQEESSSEHPFIEGKTAPCDVAVLTGQDEMGHNCQLTSEGTVQSSHQTASNENLDHEREVRMARRVQRDCAVQDCGSIQIVCDSALWVLESHKSLLARVSNRKVFQLKENGSVPVVLLSKSQELLETSSTQFSLTWCRLKISTMTVEPQLDNALLVTTNGRPDQSKPSEPPYTLKDSLKHHMLAQCCKFSKKWCLQCHKQAHAHKKAYKCNVCPAEFSRWGQLHQHKQTRMGDKPYKCDVCPAEFSRWDQLHQHKQTHTGEKPFKCNMCPAEFSRSGNLQQDKRTHTGEKPYKCDVCAAQFRQRGHLLNHKRVHTAERPY